MAPRVGLLDYRFLQFSIRHVNAENPPGAVSPRVRVLHSPPQEAGGAWLARLIVRVEPDHGQTGTSIDADVMAVLEITSDDGEEVDAETAAYFAALNGGTILYGIVRAEVASITSNFPTGRVVLPTVYIREVLERQRNEPHLSVPPDPAPSSPAP